MTDLELHPDLTPTPTTLFASDDPAVVVARATRIAETIAPLIRSQNLVKRIGQSEHVYVEAWALAGSMLGVFATTLRTWEIGDDQGYGATVEACTITGAVVGRADAVVMRSEEVGGKRKWEHAPAFQLISMAQTRGSSKALRMPLGFVMKLAGYETTPAEEMEAAAARGETVSGGRGVAAGWRDVAEQTRAHQRMDTYLEDHGLRELAGEVMESKGYTLPMAKAQMADLRRALDRELEQMSGSAQGPPPAPVGPDSTSGEDVAAGPRAGTSPDPTRRSASTPEPEVDPAHTGGVPTEADRSGVEAANHERTGKPGVGEPPPDATTPPGGPMSPRRPSGGTKRTRSAGDPERAEQVAYEQRLAGDER